MFSQTLPILLCICVLLTDIFEPKGFIVILQRKHITTFGLGFHLFMVPSYLKENRPQKQINSFIINTLLILQNLANLSTEITKQKVSTDTIK
jgi:hypothetical protein